MTPFNKELIKKTWFQNTALILAAVLAVYALIYRDVVARAKEAYMQAETYMSWHANPEKKKAYFEEKFNAEKEDLNALLKKNKITEVEYKEKLSVLEFDRDFQLNESSLKYAYQWYKDTYELFSPPESKWVRRAREQAPKTLALWKEELQAKKVPFEDYMFE